MVGGPALFLAGRARLEYEVFGRVSPSRWIVALLLLGPIPFLAHVVSLAAAATAAVLLAAVAVADARSGTGRPAGGGRRPSGHPA
ncbi:hypothetical protein ACVCAH_12500 [Micromonospora sp. LZ34]